MSNGRIMSCRGDSCVMQITSITYNCVTQKRKRKIDLLDAIPSPIFQRDEFCKKFMAQEKFPSSVSILVRQVSSYSNITYIIIKVTSTVLIAVHCAYLPQTRTLLTLFAEFPHQPSRRYHLITEIVIHWHESYTRAKMLITTLQL